MPDWVHDLWFRVYLWAHRLRHPYRWLGPRCGHRPYWRLVDAGTCILPAHHERLARADADWHADGNGYIWNATRWAWRGPILDLADVLRDHPDRDTDGDQYAATFTEDPPRG